MKKSVRTTIYLDERGRANGYEFNAIRRVGVGNVLWSSGPSVMGAVTVEWKSPRKRRAKR